MFEGLEMGIYPYIQLTGCEIIRNGISPGIADVGYPVVRRNIAYLQEVEHFNSYPKRF